MLIAKIETIRNTDDTGRSKQVDGRTLLREEGDDNAESKPDVRKGKPGEDQGDDVILCAVLECSH